MQERNLWVDYAKAIGIFLVVYAHTARGLMNAGMDMPGFHQTIDSVIYSFHMPLFFFLSGLFFCDSYQRLGSKGLISRKLETIAYPYVVWSLLQGFIEVALSEFTNGYVTPGQVLSLLWVPRAQFWFLYTLFLLFVICAFLAARSRPQLPLPLLAVFAALYATKGQFVTKDSVADFILAGLFFFALGARFNQAKQLMLAHARQCFIVFCALFLAAQYLFHDVYGMTYDVGGLAALGLAVISILFVVSLCMVLGRIRLDALVIIGSSSMSIYLMHILAASGARIGLSVFTGSDSVLLHMLVGTAAGMIGPLVAQALIERYRWYFLFTPPRVLSQRLMRFGKPA